MNEDILEGLKIALFKGESLNHAIQSFQNAGYDMKEIQEAARSLQLNPPVQNIVSNSSMPQTQNSQPNSLQVSTTNQNKPLTPIKAQKKQNEKVIPLKKTIVKPSIHKVSSYEGVQQNPRKIIVTLIIILLVILI